MDFSVVFFLSGELRKPFSVRTREFWTNCELPLTAMHVPAGQNHPRNCPHPKKSMPKADVTPSPPHPFSGRRSLPGLIRKDGFCRSSELFAASGGKAAKSR